MPGGQAALRAEPALGPLSRCPLPPTLGPGSRRGATLTSCSSAALSRACLRHLYPQGNLGWAASGGWGAGKDPNSCLAFWLVQVLSQGGCRWARPWRVLGVKGSPGPRHSCQVGRALAPHRRGLSTAPPRQDGVWAALSSLRQCWTGTERQADQCPVGGLKQAPLPPATCRGCLSTLHQGTPPGRCRPLFLTWCESRAELEPRTPGSGLGKGEAGWPRASHLTFLNLSVPICNTGLATLRAW